VRIKNRFEEDEVEDVTAEQIAAEFYSAETQGEETETQSNISSNSFHSDSSGKTKTSEKMYRDILLNIRPKGKKFICELQITLTGIAILKKSEQKIYSIVRMVKGEELKETYVFSRPPGSLGKRHST
jgi:hypothetical protein